MRVCRSPLAANPPVSAIGLNRAVAGEGTDKRVRITKGESGASRTANSSFCAAWPDWPRLAAM